MGAQQESNMNDHDLLLRLDTRFEENQKLSHRQWSDLNEKVGQILFQIQDKADKRDVQSISEQLNKKADKEMVEKILSNHEGRIHTLEEVDQKKNIQKQTVIQIGQLGIKGWGILVGVITFMIALIKALEK